MTTETNEPVTTAGTEQGLLLTVLAMVVFGVLAMWLVSV
jgi:hypothetical protein